MEALLILLPALVMCVLMVLTHAYLGLHVLARGIIFVDLALAQVAALGVSVAFLLGEEAHGHHAQLYAFGATLLAALAFARLRSLPSKTAREVSIGCVYVVATALSIVILSRSSQGMEELKALFNGNILWISWEEISVVAAAYAAIGLLHYVFRRRFIGLSFKNERHGYWWEFLFFASFAVIITLAVNIAGVLLVFAFLIIPAFAATLVVAGLRTRLLAAWGIGLLGSVLGLWLAFAADLPVGATVVSALGIMPLLTALFAMTRRRSGGR